MLESELSLRAKRLEKESAERSRAIRRSRRRKKKLTDRVRLDRERMVREREKMERDKQLQAVQIERQRVQQEQQSYTQVQLQKHIQAEQAKLVEAIPEFKDDVKADMNKINDKIDDLNNLIIKGTK